MIQRPGSQRDSRSSVGLVGRIAAFVCLTALLARPAAGACTNYPSYLHWCGSARVAAEKIAVAGSRAYAVASGAGLTVLDVSDPAAPVVLGNGDFAGSERAVAVAGRYAYVSVSEAA